jgi:hypothetical protein
LLPLSEIRFDHEKFSQFDSPRRCAHARALGVVSLERDDHHLDARH